MVALGVLLALAGCKDTTCRGVEVDGRCEPACQDSECDKDGLCLDNQCADRCEVDADCSEGTCERTDADNGKRARLCVTLRDAGPSNGGADDDVEAQCQVNDDCDTGNGQHCVGGLCRVTCTLHSHCGPAGACTLDTEDDEGESVSLCESDGFPRGDGEYGATCPNGATDCAGDFRCVSAGEGDADGYCTQRGCDDDLDCPTGFTCSYNRTPSPPCATACGIAGDASDPRCVPADLIGEDNAYRCTDGQLELRICLRRDYCAECDSDADCRSVPGQVCADGGNGSKICTVLCDPGTNSCPWGTASSCDVWDTRLGLPTCSHRAGSCHGAGNSCDPCLDDRDCPRGFCSISSFSGEQFCVDETVTCACDDGQASCQGGGCPATPGGLTMNCVQRAEDAPPDACYGALTIEGLTSAPLGCWPQPGPSF